MNSIIRADGSPNFAMTATLAGAGINIILDPVFIFIFKWEMMGAAVAMVIGQVITAILSIWYLFHMKIVKPSRKDFIMKQKIYGKMLVLGITSFLSQISLVAAMAAINNMLRKFGAMDAIFGQMQYAQIPMAVGCIPIVGFNIGAGNKIRVRELFTKLLTSEVIVGGIAFYSG